jgi:hypothetical protein
MPDDTDVLDAHLVTIRTPRPGRRWCARTRELLSDPGVRAHVIGTVRGYARRRPPEDGNRPRSGVADDGTAAGFVWAAALAGDPRTLDDLVTVIRHSGWVSRRFTWDQILAHAAIAALGELDHPGTVDALRGLEKELGYPGARKQIEIALRSAAGRQGLTPGQLAERGVPAHGLGRDGSVMAEIGGYQAVLAIVGPRTVRTTFTDANGELRRTLPPALKHGHDDEVREFKALAKQVRRTLGDERGRIEALLASGRTWAYDEWCRHYRDHPITGAVTSGLIWEFEGRDGVWRAATPSGGVLVTVDGGTLSPPVGDGRVRLWHPVHATGPQIHAWRAFVHENAMAQPFKQAFREIYLLTPAEERAGTYSDRFAAHIVRYGQLVALIKERGWRSNFLGRHEEGYHGKARKILADGAWRACFRHEPAEEDYETHPAHAVTGQMRFERADGRRSDEVPLADVPAVVFSEAMRDVDLFVGVTSIATDPEWADRGDDRYTGYWRRTATGGLTATAEVRRDTLARVLPRTRIAGRCSLVGRFLVVRGDLRTYKIHLGSAGILMEPDDTYLCVVSARRAPMGAVFLPFEDERLSLILSKAFLLAGDVRITDETILRQIKGNR